MNGRQFVIGLLVALLVVLAVAMAASVGAIFAMVPVSSAPIVQAPSAPEISISIPDVPVRFGSAPFEKTETEVKVAPAPISTSLEMENQLGNTVITGANVQEVRVRATKHGRGLSPEAAAEDLKKLAVEVTQQEGKVLVSGRRIGQLEGFPSQGGSIDLEVTVPEGMPLAIKTSLGAVRIVGVRAPVRVSSSMGNVELSDVEGDIDVTAKLGNVDIENGKVTRTLHLVSEMGQISFEGQLPPQGEGSIQAKMGNVVLELPPSTSARIDAAAKVGKVKSDFPGELSSRGPGSALAASSGRGGFQLRIENEMGNVELNKTP